VYKFKCTKVYKFNYNLNVNDDGGRDVMCIDAGKTINLKVQKSI
jgi:hypothetical protein